VVYISDVYGSDSDKKSKLLPELQACNRLFIFQFAELKLNAVSKLLEESLTVHQITENSTHI